MAKHIKAARSRLLAQSQDRAQEKANRIAFQEQTSGAGTAARSVFGDRGFARKKLLHYRQCRA